MTQSKKPGIYLIGVINYKQTVAIRYESEDDVPKQHAEPFREIAEQIGLGIQEEPINNMVDGDVTLGVPVEFWVNEPVVNAKGIPVTFVVTTEVIGDTRSIFESADYDDEDDDNIYKHLIGSLEAAITRKLNSVSDDSTIVTGTVDVSPASEVLIRDLRRGFEGEEA